MGFDIVVSFGLEAREACRYLIWPTSRDMRNIICDAIVNVRSNDMQNITGGQMRAARALLRWRAEDLAEKSAVGVATIRRAELIDGPTNMTSPNAAAVQRALEAAGIQFIPENGGGAGVRLAKRPAPAKDEGKRPDELNASNAD